MPGATNIISTGTAKTMGIGRTIVKNWYWIVLIFVLIPTIYTSVHTAIETKNVAYPFIQLGIHLSNADALIYEDVQSLREDPSKLIGMEKPTSGIYHKFIYNWGLFKVIWRFLSNLWLITFPFVFLYRVVFNPIDDSKKWRSIFRTAFWGCLIITFINLGIIAYKYKMGEALYTFPEGIGQFGTIGLIYLYSLPFHGVVALVQYLITLI